MASNFNKRPFGDASLHEAGSVDPRNTPYDVLSVLHYGPLDASKNGEPVFTYRYGLPGQDWREPEPNDPLSIVDQVELALAYGCTENLSTDFIIDYIHSNRKSNALRIDTLEPKLVKIEGEAAELKDIVRQLQTTVDGKIEKIEDEAAELKNSVNGLSTRIGNSENTAGELQTTVARLSKRGAQCGHRSHWTSQSSTITYSKTLLNSGSGSLDKNTGIWTAGDSGLYQVTWSLINWVDSSAQNRIYLYKNNGRIDESQLYSTSVGYIYEQGGRTLVLDLQKNDRLHLRTSHFSGNGAYDITFCVHLISAAP